jgi:hypothetical protein
MGLFQQRPEEPTQWAGIPSDPARAESTAERLPNVAPIRAGDDLFPGDATASISITVDPVTEAVSPAVADEGNDSGS